MTSALNEDENRLGQVQLGGQRAHQLSLVVLASGGGSYDRWFPARAGREPHSVTALHQQPCFWNAAFVVYFPTG
jgi:hypothetical protein